MPSAGGSVRILLLGAALLGTASCAGRLPPRPSGAPSAAGDAAVIFAGATTHCASLRTMTMELGLSGRAGDEKLRGRVITGLERGGAARLEGLAPFGAPLFILAARGERATLLLPRDRRVLEPTTVAEVLERFTGLALGADDLLHALSGCLGAGGAVEDGRQWPGGWRAVSVAGERTAYLREESGAWRVAAVDGGGWRADYAETVNGFPRTVRLRSIDGAVDLTARVQQLEVNTAIDAAAFEVAIPPDTEPMTIEELRSVAPLRTP